MAVKETQINKLVGSDVHLVRFDGREFVGELTRGARVSDEGEPEFVIQAGTRGRPPFFFPSEVDSIRKATVDELVKVRNARDTAREAAREVARPSRKAAVRGSRPTKAEVRRAFTEADKAMAHLAALVERATAV